MKVSNVSIGLRIAFIIGIAILFPAVTFFGTATVFERPEYPSYNEEISKQERSDRFETYREKKEAFTLKYFWVAVPLGLVAIGLGLMARLGDIGTGFVFGGIISIACGHFGAWSYIDDELRFASSLIGLALLLFVAYRRTAVRGEPAQY